MRVLVRVLAAAAAVCIVAGSASADWADWMLKTQQPGSAVRPQMPLQPFGLQQPHQVAAPTLNPPSRRDVPEVAVTPHMPMLNTSPPDQVLQPSQVQVDMPAPAERPPMPAPIPVQQPIPFLCKTPNLTCQVLSPGDCACQDDGGNVESGTTN